MKATRSCSRWIQYWRDLPFSQEYFINCVRDVIGLDSLREDIVRVRKVAMP